MTRSAKYMPFGWITLPVVLALALLVVGTSGCGGCRRNAGSADKSSDKEEDEQKGDKPKEPFTTQEFAILPASESIVGNPVKPGHWTAARVRWVANESDFAGQVDAFPVDARGQPQRLEVTDDLLRTVRPVSLPKAQPKDLELTFYTPRVEASVQQLRTDLNLDGGRLAFTDTRVIRSMPPHQYYLVVLARQPDAYGFLRFLTAVARPRTADDLDDNATTHLDYLVTMPKSERGVALPSSPMAWTSISHVIWDEFDAQQFTPSQRQAMLDWLHWGGQLVIPAPRSLDSMRGTFLEPYLPASLGEARPMTDADLEPLNQWLSRVKADEKLRQRLYPMLDDSPPELIELQLHPEASFVPGCEPLVAERRVGRGRVVVTSFLLKDRAFRDTWLGLDTFVNAVLLGRPPRMFEIESTSYLPRMRWRDLPLADADPRINTHLRIFARDADASEAPDHEPFMREVQMAGFGTDGRSGVGGWTESSACAELAREALNEAAGIEVPSRMLIAAMLGLYLVLLVPVNWALFRSIGRVEWAWATVPVMALVGTVVVARLAQLDIGFARSRTEIGVLEVQPGYARGHLSRYAALYTSLATSYRAEFVDRFALATSFPVSPQQGNAFRPRSALTLHHGQQSVLRGIQVPSNSTEMFHSEEFVDVGGSFRLRKLGPETFELDNQTQFDFQQVGVLWRDAEDRIRRAWIDRLPAGQIRTIEMQLAENPDRPFPEWERADSDSIRATLTPILRLAAHPDRLATGQMTMVGLSDQPIPGANVLPEASQSHFQTVLVAHLDYGQAMRPEPDANLLQSVMKEESDSLDTEIDAGAIDYSQGP